jgi:hypothetical protein
MKQLVKINNNNSSNNNNNVYTAPVPHFTNIGLIAPKTVITVRQIRAWLKLWTRITLCILDQFSSSSL